MKNKRSLCLLVFSIMFTSQYAFCQGLVVEYSDSYLNLSIQSEQIKMKCDWVMPSIQPAVPVGQWKHLNRIVVYDELAGMPGQRTTDIFILADIVMERQLWVSGDEKVVALRQKLRNSRKEALHLQAMFPLACEGNQSFQMPENPETEKWYINVQKRLKNEFPETVRPSDQNSVIADPFLAIPVESDPNGSCLLVGYLDWMKHLAHFDMSFMRKRGELVFKGLTAICEFDNVVVPPNGERTTQWIYITVGQDFNSSVEEYADRVGKYHHIAEPPRNAPTLYCSWYWYGLNYTEEYFMRDLEALKNLGSRKPFDVFLIDEAWGIELWGDYTANEKFPSGMKFAADRIREMGYIPGIWTPPYLVSHTSTLVKEHPEWVLRSSTR